MDMKANKKDIHRPARERDSRRIPDREQRKRLNPRYVFTDPNDFFHDLLMEQNEQG